MFNLNKTGLDWIFDQIDELTETIEYKSPVEFAEEFRILPRGTTNDSGPMSFDMNPYMREILNCFSMQSPVREVNLMKGVQMTYTVSLLETVVLYVMAYLKIYPMGFVSADNGLVKQRIENNILPMLKESGFADIIQSPDVGNSKKSGKTKELIQWRGGGFMIPLGAKNPAKMRSNSVLFMLKDEIDAWGQTVGNDGCPDVLTDGRCKAYGDDRKILRGSTPLIKHTSKIYKNYLKGDQRKYFVNCKKCGFSQFLEWRNKNNEGKTYGFAFETPGGILEPSSVRYLCKNCLHEHYEYDKHDLFSEDKGAFWKPTAQAVKQGIRSYHLPSFYSPIGFQSWINCVEDFLLGWDNVNNKMIDFGSYQVFFNNVRGEPFEVIGDRVRFTNVSLHRRSCYHLKEIPNAFAAKYCGSEILFLICTVDVHGKTLFVKVTGVCREFRTFVIDYFTIEGDNCEDINDKSWTELEEYIDEEHKFKSDNGREYRIFATFIDAGFATDTVKAFTENYMGSLVFPIFGRETLKKTAKTGMKTFVETKSNSGKVGYSIHVDYYKNRLAPVLRRSWEEARGEEQRKYHWNAPVDISDAQLKELTVETKREETDGRGGKKFVWHRPSGSANELWDLTVYAHAGVEIVAYLICVAHFGLEAIDWAQFWNWAEQNMFAECPLPEE